MKNIYFVLVLVAFSACNFCRNENNADFRLKEVIEKEVAKLSDFGIEDVWGITQKNGCFLFNGTNGVKIIPIADLEEKIEPLRACSNDIPNKCFIAYDFIKENLFEFIIGKSGEVISQELGLPEGKLHIAAVKGRDFVISTGIYEEGRYFYSVQNIEESKYCLSYPLHSSFPDIAEKTKAILYASVVLRLSPDEKAFVCADMYSGNIEFCKIEGGDIISVKQLCFHLPDVKIKGRENVIYKRSNQMGFSDITVSRDRVYAIHSGKTYLKNNVDFMDCNELLEFDWEGNLLNTYNLKKSVTNILYNEEKHMLYAVKNELDIPFLTIELPD